MGANETPVQGVDLLQSAAAFEAQTRCPVEASRAYRPSSSRGMKFPPFGKLVPTLGTKIFSPSTITPQYSAPAFGSGSSAVRVDQRMRPVSGSKAKVVPS